MAVNMMVLFLGTLHIRGRIILRRTERDHNFDNLPGGYFTRASPIHEARKPRTLAWLGGLGSGIQGLDRGTFYYCPAVAPPLFLASCPSFQQ